VATFFTFLPSFIFILLGAPLIETTRDNIRMTAPLTAISAAVVGVIVSLALFFAEHIFHLGSPPGAWDWPAMGLTALSCIALFRFKIGAIPVIVACAIAGLVVSSLH
jgi:chromate transporter